MEKKVQEEDVVEEDVEEENVAEKGVEVDKNAGMQSTQEKKT